MSRWTTFRDKITTFITNNGSTVTITPRTPTAGSYGGYEPSSDNAGSAVSTVGVSFDYMNSKSGQKFGKLKTGELGIFLKYSETVAKDYVITWQSDTYSIREIKEIRAGDVLICYRVTFSRKLD